MRAVISHDDVWEALLFAMRYAIGRYSYAPEDVAAMIATEAQVATPHQCKDMANQIREEAHYVVGGRRRAKDRVHLDELSDWEGVREFTNLLPMLEERAGERDAG